MDGWLIKDLLKRYKQKPLIGYWIESVQDYNKALASVRMRVYDVIDYLDKYGISAELYKKNRDYKLVIVYKPVKKETLQLVHSLKDKGIKVIYEGINDYMADHDIKKHPEWKYVEEIIKLADGVITVPGMAVRELKKYNDNVFGLSEAVSYNLLAFKKKVSNVPKCDLIYCGYSTKAKDLLLIKDVLNDYQKRYGATLWIISDRRPKLENLKYDFIKYDNKVIGRQLAKGDVFVAPRNMNSDLSYINSINKIAYPMAIGLPVLASPIESYMGSPALLCYNKEDWIENLNSMAQNHERMRQIGKNSVEYVNNNLSMDIIGKEYVKIFNKYV